MGTEIQTMPITLQSKWVSIGMTMWQDIRPQIKILPESKFTLISQVKNANRPSLAV